MNPEMLKKVAEMAHLCILNHYFFVFHVCKLLQL